MVISQFLPIFEVASPVGQLVGIAFVLFVSAFKEAVEDMRRHQNDREVNDKTVFKVVLGKDWRNVNEAAGLSGVAKGGRWLDKLLRYGTPVKPTTTGTSTSASSHPPPSPTARASTYSASSNTPLSPQSPQKQHLPSPPSPTTPHFPLVPWHSLLPGDLVLLRSDDAVPADIVPLASSEKAGVCRLETKSLDGETNLKSRWCVGWDDGYLSGDAAAAETPDDYGFRGDDLAKVADPDPGAEGFPSTDPTRDPALHRALARLATTWMAVDAEPPSASLVKFQGRLVVVDGEVREKVEKEARERDNGGGMWRRRGSRVVPTVGAGGGAGAGAGLGTGGGTGTSPSPSSLVPATRRTSLAPRPGTLTRPTPLPATLTLPLPTPPPPPLVFPLDLSNLLLRGAVVRNTGWVVGIVVYTGHDTRVVRNGGQVKGKQSRAERVMNVMVTLNFVLMILMAMATSARYVAVFATYSKENPAPLFAKGNHDNNIAGFFITFWTSMIVIQTIIPISLYTTIEIARAFQVYFIAEDDDMLDTSLPGVDGTGVRARPRNWNVMDDMGQIEVVLSDKTGTLTQNKMEFRSCSIGGVLMHAEDEKLGGNLERTLSRRRRGLGSDQGGAGMRAGVPEGPHLDVVQGGIRESRGEKSETILADADPLSKSNNSGVTESDSDPSEPNSSLLGHFLTCLAVCHTVPTPIAPHFAIQAESPDEKALVEFGRRCNFEFLSRSADGRWVRIGTRGGKVEEFEVLHICEFSSERRMMSVVVRKVGEEGVLVYSKGADSTVIPRAPDTSASLIAATNEHLTQFARLGLRTLCVAYRRITTDQYIRWKEQLDEAMQSMEDREEAVQSVYGDLECDMRLVGATAIEDRLQDEVPETIRDLQLAGMKVWVETAVNIGYSCQLLNSTMTVHTITSPDPGANVARQLHDINNSLKAPSPKRLSPLQAKLLKRYPSLKALFIAMGKFTLGRRSPEQSLVSYGLVMDGDAVAIALETDRGRQELLDLATRCDGVMFCRMSPRQKWEICTIVRQGMDVVVAAVGDGANDVGMIEEANIGVGIVGSEGNQAAAASDYSISQFRFLANLFFVHGRWSYVRLALMVSNIFYKNLAWASMNYTYQYFAANTATFATDYLYVLLFNVVFTSATVVTMGTLEQDIPKTVALAHPELYPQARVDTSFDLKSFFWFVLDSMYQGAVCFFVPFGVTYDGNFSSGLPVDRISIGVMSALNVVVAVNISTLLQQRYWNFLTLIIHVGSTSLVFIATIVLSSLRITLTELEGSSRVVLTEVAVHAQIILAVVVALLPSKFEGDLAKKREYTVVRLLGKGAQGQVEEAIHGPTGKHVALKTIRKVTSGGSSAVHGSSEEIAAAWRREVAILQTAKWHPNVCELIDYFEDKTNFYMVFALATGGELFDRVVSRGHLTERDSALILATLCNVLAFLHAHGIVHRDLRTKNIVFKDPSPSSPLLLVDFGIANRIEKDQERLRTQIGTPLYTAPEVWDGNGYGTPADMFSLGMIAHTLLTGSPPSWTGGKVRQLAFTHPAWRVLSPESRNFVKQLLAMSPLTRMTAEVALEHPWLRKFLSKQEIANMRHLKVGSSHVLGCDAKYSPDLRQVNAEAFLATGPPRNLENLVPGLLIDQLWNEHEEPYWGYQFQATESEFEWIAWLDDQRRASVGSHSRISSLLMNNGLRTSQDGVRPSVGKGEAVSAVLINATVVAPVAVHGGPSVERTDWNNNVPIPIPPTPPVSTSPESASLAICVPPRPSSTGRRSTDGITKESPPSHNVGGVPLSKQLPNLLEQGDYVKRTLSIKNSPEDNSALALLSRSRESIKRLGSNGKDSLLSSLENQAAGMVSAAENKER
ncbi:hypothetical protein HDU93_004995 [Gonapodya sp. JEL0774]|nr:hypothetical protein HDU93_004995 [Gonapodya sp. JEL0774]